jgi:Holliday junction resolvase RusA-like endonuclease
VAHDRKPDLDNVVKAVCDALQRSVIRDDSSVCSLHAVKVYSRSEEPACVQVRLCWGDAVEAMR